MICGQETCEQAPGVNSISLNLSVSRPDLTPQKSAAVTNGRGGQVNDEFAAFFDQLVRIARRADRNIGHSGFAADDAGPCGGHDVGFSMVPQLTITGGNGYSIVPGFQVIFAILNFSCQNMFMLVS